MGINAVVMFHEDMCENSVEQRKLLSYFGLLSRLLERIILVIQDRSEIRVLLDLQSFLEKQLPEPFLKDYETSLDKAWSEMCCEGGFTHAENEQIQGKLSL